MTKAVEWIRTRPSAVLLASQVIAVLVYPFLSDSGLGRSVLGVVSMVIVGMALWAVRRTPALNVVAFSLGLPALVFAVLEAYFPQNDPIVLISACLHAPFYFYVSFGLIRYLFHDNHVSSDELYATGAAFTVVAWGFAYLFSACQVIWPGSFTAPGAAVHTQGWFELLFLSFTTLTSVGLSDITPTLGHARSIVMLEQFAGVMYVALVVARLVGLTIMRQRPDDR